MQGNWTLALHVGSACSGKGKIVPGFLCLGMTVSGVRMGNKIKLACLESLHLGVLPTMPFLWQLGASSSWRHAEQAWDVCWGWMQSRPCSTGTVVPQLHQGMHSWCSEITNVSARNHQYQSWTLCAWFKLIRLQFWSCWLEQEFLLRVIPEKPAKRGFSPAVAVNHVGNQKRMGLIRPLSGKIQSIPCNCTALCSGLDQVPDPYGNDSFFVCLFLVVGLFSVGLLPWSCLHRSSGTADLNGVRQTAWLSSRGEGALGQD